jgi:hypothetical protein
MIERGKDKQILTKGERAQHLAGELRTEYEKSMLARLCPPLTGRVLVEKSELDKPASNERLQVCTGMAPETTILGRLASLVGEKIMDKPERDYIAEMRRVNRLPEEETVIFEEKGRIE